MSASDLDGYRSQPRTAHPAIFPGDESFDPVNSPIQFGTLGALFRADVGISEDSVGSSSRTIQRDRRFPLCKVVDSFGKESAVTRCKGSTFVRWVG